MKQRKNLTLLFFTLLVVIKVVLLLVGCKNDSWFEKEVFVGEEQENNDLIFISEDETYLKTHFSGEIGVPNGMQYSTDGITWKEFTKPQVDISFGKDTKLYLRGKSLTGTAMALVSEEASVQSYIRFEFKDGTRVRAAGDIRYLVDYENPTKADTSNARFYFLFKDCNELISPPELPATTLADNCYVAMFDSCTNLERAPELPSITLAENCYHHMFDGCISLRESPKLKATTVTAGCYSHMFDSCISLEDGPELPATVLAENCYRGMFNGCENLNSITMLATDVNADNALLHWLVNTSESGTLHVVDTEMKKNEIITKSLPVDKKWEVVVKTN